MSHQWTFMPLTPGDSVAGTLAQTPTRVKEFSVIHCEVYDNTPRNGVVGTAQS